MNTHRLKCHSEQFRALTRYKKKAEFRKNDRNYQVGDGLDLVEWDPINDEPMSNTFRCVVTHIVHGPAFGIPEGYCMMSIG